jgi:hypothetical protein
MRFVLCLLLATVLSGSVVAAKETMSLSQAQAAAAKGDQKAAAAVQTTTDQQTCLRECANRGYSHCDVGCRPGLCHPDGDTPYCVAK